MKSLLGIAFAAVLALAPKSAFAQHGGGGGGGHSGGGGGHSSGGGGGHSAVASGGGGAHVAAPARAGGTPAAAALPGVASGNSSVVSTRFVGQGAATGVPAERFAAGNILWSEPPGKSNPSSMAIPANGFHAESPNIPASEPRVAAFAARAQSASPASANHFARAPVMRTPATVQIPLMPHFGPIPPRNRNSQNFFLFPGGCFSGFNGFFPGCGFGGGFFFGAPFFGFGYGYGYGYGAGYGYGYPGCDPDWGCSGYGDYGLSANPGAAGEGGTPQQPFDDEKLSWQDPPLRSEIANAAPNPATILYLTDGTSFSVTTYWLAEGSLNYVTTYGGRNSIPAAQLDWQRTVNENAARGVAVTLRPTPQPETTSPAPPVPLPPPDPAAPDAPQQ